MPLNSATQLAYLVVSFQLYWILGTPYREDKEGDGKQALPGEKKSSMSGVLDIKRQKSSSDEGSVFHEWHYLVLFKLSIIP